MTEREVTAKREAPARQDVRHDRRRPRSVPREAEVETLGPPPIGRAMPRRTADSAEGLRR